MTGRESIIAMMAVRQCVIGCLLVGALLLTSEARADPDNKALYRDVFAAAEIGQWNKARGLAAKGPYPSLAKLLTWMRLTKAQPVPRFEEISGFIAANPEWPGLDRLRQRTESAMGDAMEPDRVIEWFSATPPLSGVGMMRLAEAHRAMGDDAKAAGLLREAWINGDLSRQEAKTFNRRYHHDMTREDNVARLDKLLWDGKRGAARRMLRRVDAGQRALGEARMALRAFAGGVDGAIARVPALLRDDPSLWYERLRWRRRKSKHESAREILANLPDVLVRPALWWRETKIEVRKALQGGLAPEAYQFAADHRQTDVVTRSEAEWLAGWISLRFLDKADQAYHHFIALYNGVSYPISLTRGAYWSGRAAKDPELAREWFELASQYPTTFYGQLALAEMGKPFELPAEQPVSEADRAAIAGRELTVVVRALAKVGPTKLLRPFVNRLTDLAETPGQRRLVAEIAVETGRPEVGVLAARRSTRVGDALIEYAYPLIGIPPGRGAAGQVDEALLLAMLRQESGFASTARSSAGALGLLQLMPATARKVASRIGLAYNKSRLTSDPAYNLTLGRAYMAELLDAYDGSYVLAIAAYNGGARRVRTWIKRFGDPRDRDIDVIDWIEMIPISETRNYVQRVMETVAVYRRRLGRQAPTHDLWLDLNRGLR